MKLIAALLGLYVVYAVIMVVLHPRLIYPFFAEDQVLPGFTRFILKGADGIEISVQEHQNDGPIVLYFMGNAGSLSLFKSAFTRHLQQGRHVIALEYRGGGGRPGDPSEEILKSDALIAADYALAAGKPVVVQGHSLGTGLATHVGARRPVADVILVLPYDRLCRLMATRAKLPACWMPGVQKWMSIEDAAQIDASILVLHGTDDTLIPVERSAAFANLSQVSRVLIDGAGHQNMYASPETHDQIEGIFDRLAN